MQSQPLQATSAAPSRRPMWLDYRMVWRWHFYAGLFAIPFVLWLSVTGSIYLFRPQIERWLDRPYDHLVFTGPLKSPAAQTAAALAAVPGSNLHDYQLPRTAHSAVQILVGRGPTEYRVYVDPQTLRILQVQQEEHRPMRILFHLHGELLLGDRGSNIVELAASWTIVLILTGIYLWWPRQTDKLAGVVYIRLRQGSRLFWRDLHGVTAIWICAWTLFLLFSGLPWAAGWGGYLKKIRALTSNAAVHQDWSTGSSSERAQRMALNHNSLAAEGRVRIGKDALAPLSVMVAHVTPLQLPYPVLISPPMHRGGPWKAHSDTPDRPDRVTLLLNPTTEAVLHRTGFRQRSWVDEAVAVGVAAHEGQLFGVLNQLIGLCTAMGLITLCISAIVLWWRRRDAGILGAPVAVRRPTPSLGLIASVVALAVYLPMMGGSLIVVLLTERFVLRRIPFTQHWLGL